MKREDWLDTGLIEWRHARNRARWAKMALRYWLLHPSEIGRGVALEVEWARSTLVEEVPSR